MLSSNLLVALMITCLWPLLLLVLLSACSALERKTLSRLPVQARPAKRTAQELPGPPLLVALAEAAPVLARPAPGA